MPLPLLPIAGVVLRVGLPALVGYAAARALRTGRTDQSAEDVLDGIDEGLAVHRPRDRGQTNAAARFRRVLRWGTKGVEIDAALLGRFRVRKVD
jgi:hypothetical protein